MRGTRAWGIAGAFLLALALAIVITTRTQQEITITSGMPGGTMNSAAENITPFLERAGFKVTTNFSDSTTDMIQRVTDANNATDVTFMYGTVAPSSSQDAVSLGTIAKVPVLFATVSPAPSADNLGDLRGMRVDVGSPNSEQANFSKDVLALYGVDDSTATLEYRSAPLSREGLLERGVQAVSVRWDDSASRTLLEGMVASGEMSIIPIKEARAIASQIPSAEPMELPPGILRLAPALPEQAIPVLGQLFTVIAKPDISPSAAYAIADALTERYSLSSAFAEAGEYPNFQERQFRINPNAAEFYLTGDAPWQFENLPPIVADSYVALLIFLSALLLIATLYSALLPEAYSLWTGVLQPRGEERQLNVMERALAEGRELTVTQRARLSKILARQDQGRALRQRAETLRPELSEVVEDQSPRNDP